MPAYKADAIVLHRINLGETDKIITLLTREHGKLNAVAKGARKPTSKLSGATELFTLSRLLLATGKSLDIITQCEIQEYWSPLRNDLQLLARATYLCELTDRSLEEREANPGIYDLLRAALHLLQRRHDLPDVIVHAYELHLLAERGYAPELNNCVKCGEALEQDSTGFSPLLGGAICQADRYNIPDTIQVHPKTLGLLRRLLASDAEVLARIEPPKEILREVSRCLTRYIQVRLERSLKSAEFLDILRSQPDG